MLFHPVLEKLRSMNLKGMAQHLERQTIDEELTTMTFEERLGLMVEEEWCLREDRKLQNRIRKAKLRQQACLEDLDYRSDRSLDRTLVASLETCDWIKKNYNVLITGATGTGKTYLAEALAHKACLKGFKALNTRIDRMLMELAIARGDGTYLMKMNAMSKVDILILDDFGISPIKDGIARDLLELMDDRHGNKSTIITSQLPLNNWHDAITDKTLADAILDRLVHNAYKIELKGPSMRRVQAESKKL